MTIIEAVKEMDYLYERLVNCSSTFGKANNGRQMYALLEEFPSLNNYWETRDAHLWNKRFVKIKSIDITIKIELDVFDDGIDYKTPEAEGLYFLGETHFNPHTHEEFYWVKVGKASNFKNRFRQYNTCNPMCYRIDYSSAYEAEAYYQERIKEKAIAKCNHNSEWFLVDRETYLEMCENGFAYFD